MPQVETPGVLRGDCFMSLADIQIRSARAASALAAAGVGAGDTVALLLRNDHPFFEASFAAGLLGASPVPLNWHGKPEELQYVLADSRAKVLVAHADLLRGWTPSTDVVVRVVETPADIAEAYGIDPAACSVPPDVPRWDHWVDGFGPWTGAAPGWVDTMIYTSGTTGRPKGVRRKPFDGRDPEQLLQLIEANQAIGLQPGVRSVVTGPMYHTAPNTFALTHLRLGGFLVLQPRYDAEQLLALVEQHRITHLHMVPTMFVRLLQLPEAVRATYDVSSLEHVVHAAAPCPEHVKRQMIEWWGPIVHEYYGGTESGPVVACTSEEWLAHPGTVGRPLPTGVVRILDDDGNEVPLRTPGEVYMRLGGFPDFTYEGRPEERAKVERDGLITCGDIGYVDEDGFLYLCDRKRDMVISGGVNIYPAEIEACVLTAPGVRDCAVFGIPDEEFGEALAAYVEPLPGATLTADGIRAHVRKHLANFKVPKVVELRADLPREDSGKIFKRKLRDPYWEQAGRRI